MIEIRPGVWRLRAFASRRAIGSLMRITKTIEAKDLRGGAGIRLTERELPAMVAQIQRDDEAASSEPFGELVDAWLDHIEPNRSPTTIRKYRDIADRIVLPE